MDAPNCSAVMLELPPLRGGCAADARYALEQRAGGGAWARVRDAPMPSHASEGGASGGAGGRPFSVVLGGLEPYTAYAYRLVAHNGLGESQGASTGPLLTDAVAVRSQAFGPRVAWARSFMCLFSTS